MKDRIVHLNVRMAPDELAKVKALAEDRDLTASTLIRHWLREAYANSVDVIIPSSDILRRPERRWELRHQVRVALETIEHAVLEKANFKLIDIGAQGGEPDPLA